VVVPPYEAAESEGVITGLDLYHDALEEPLQLYPSPAQDEVTVLYRSGQPTTPVFQLIDAQGRVLREQKALTSARHHEQRFAIQPLHSGTYFIRVLGSQPVSKKLVKR
jgi:Secretion system C-terminal sorting domain